MEGSTKLLVRWLIYESLSDWISRQAVGTPVATFALKMKARERAKHTWDRNFWLGPAGEDRPTV